MQFQPLLRLLFSCSLAFFCSVVHATDAEVDTGELLTQQMASEEMSDHIAQQRQEFLASQPAGNEHIAPLLGRWLWSGDAGQGSMTFDDDNQVAIEFTESAEPQMIGVVGRASYVAKLQSDGSVKLSFAFFQLEDEFLIASNSPMPTDQDELNIQLALMRNMLSLAALDGVARPRSKNSIVLRTTGKQLGQKIDEKMLLKRDRNTSEIKPILAEASSAETIALLPSSLNGDWLVNDRPVTFQSDGQMIAMGEEEGERRRYAWDASTGRLSLGGGRPVMDPEVIQMMASMMGEEAEPVLSMRALNAEELPALADDKQLAVFVCTGVGDDGSLSFAAELKGRLMQLEFRPQQAR